MWAALLRLMRLRAGAATCACRVELRSIRFILTDPQSLTLPARVALAEAGNFSCLQRRNGTETDAPSRHYAAAATINCGPAAAGAPRALRPPCGPCRRTAKASAHPGRHSAPAARPSSPISNASLSPVSQLKISRKTTRPTHPTPNIEEKRQRD